ncbi:hypothetical protein CDEST_01284 [Colletotrichum destructivum]|uniref:Uncharacterized protein n=1 Tax=Colletotrichum destructivum TaxID=34406 RepID=A0AAX4HYS6_9PEZI|nr:hypothetical protein CDEST_01284 [Colletotrichum destructivum]
MPLLTIPDPVLDPNRTVAPSLLVFTLPAHHASRPLFVCRLQSNHRCQSLVMPSAPISLTTMEGELAKLRQQIREEQHRLEEAKELAKTSRPQAHQDHLEACRSLSLAIQVVTDRSLTTQGDTTDTTNPTRCCRKRGAETRR